MKTNNLITILRRIFMIKNVHKEDNFLKKLISNNSGVSSKNFFLVSVTIIGLILLLVPAVTLIIEIIFTHTIATDLTGMAAYIGAVGTLFFSAGITKAWSEKFEIKDEEIVVPNESDVPDETNHQHQGVRHPFRLGSKVPIPKKPTIIRHFRYKAK